MRERLRHHIRTQSASFGRFARSRRGGGTLTASAALLCAGTLLAASGDDGGQSPYVAVGSAGHSEAGDSGKPVPPKGGVKMVPLPREGQGAGSSDGSGTGSSPGSSGEGAPGAGGATGSGSGSGAGSGSDSGSAGQSPSAPQETPGGGGAPDTSAPGSGGGSNGGSGGGSSGSGSGSGKANPEGPAKVDAGKPHRAKLDDRWCEKVSVVFRNTGGRAAKSGTVTFETHIIGALGVDWGTIKTERALPAPIGPGERKKGSWNVCVDQWRVPLGMRVKTEDVRVELGKKPEKPQKDAAREDGDAKAGDSRSGGDGEQKSGGGVLGTGL
ncbi:hypothetical protein [Streptomyces sp. ODS28]|uniref:hypothetical protein n=1 Tax=Streptomyces sp. ODS28 TaxID=3136688 RepID=UPI0031EF75DF